MDPARGPRGAQIIVGSLAALAGTIAAVVSWIGALLNTWQLEDKMWFGLLLAGVLGLGVVAMIAYVVADPDGTSRAWHAQAARGCPHVKTAERAAVLTRAVSYEGAGGRRSR